LSKSELAQNLKSVAVGIGVSVLLAAPILVAFIDYLPNADIGGHAGAFARASLPVQALPMQIMPYLFGPIFGFSPRSAGLYVLWGNIGGYLSASLTLLAIVGLTGRRYRALRFVLGAWVVVGLTRLVGVGWALDVVNAIPGVKSTAFYRYADASWEMAVIVLASLGLDDVIRRAVSRWVLVASGIVMVGLCLLGWRSALPILHAISAESTSASWAAWSVSWALVTVLTIVVLGALPDFDIGRVRSRTIRPIALGCIVIVEVIAMFATPQFSAPRQAAIDTKAVAYLTQHLGNYRFFTFGPLAPNYGSYFALSSLDVNDVPIPKRFETFVDSQLDSNVDPLIFTGGTMANPSGPSPQQEFVDHLSAYEAAGVKYAVLPASELLPSSSVPLRRVYGDAVVSLLELPHPAPLFTTSSTRCEVRIVSVTSVQARCPTPTELIYRELSMPGWHADVNDRAVPVRSSGRAFQAVDLPAGESTVTFGFTPEHAFLAFVLFMLGLLLLLAALVPARWRPDARRPRHGRRRKRGAGRVGRDRRPSSARNGTAGGSKSGVARSRCYPALVLKARTE
jgi:hypothetical protein